MSRHLRTIDICTVMGRHLRTAYAMCASSIFCPVTHATVGLLFITLKLTSFVLVNGNQTGPKFCYATVGIKVLVNQSFVVFSTAK